MKLRCTLRLHKWDNYRRNFRRCIFCGRKEKQETVVTSDGLGTEEVWREYVSPKKQKKEASNGN